VGYDGRTGDRAPLNFGVAAARFTGAPLIVAAVRTGSAALGAAGSAIVEEEYEARPGALEGLQRELEGEGIKVECRSVHGSSAAHALHRAAEEFDAGLLVLGSSERGSVGRLLPGSTAQRLMHGAPCPLAVVPAGWSQTGRLRTIGVAFIDTPDGHAALDGALALARRTGAGVRVLTAAKPHGFSQTFGGGDPLTPATRFEEIASGIRLAAERAIEEATAGDGAVEIEADVSVGDPAAFLIAASENVDLLVCGSRSYGPTRAVLLGGVSRHITAEARCPVIVLARGVEGGLATLIGEQSEAVG